jgi:hypothetical protein
MEKLPITRITNNLFLTQVKRSDSVALYDVRHKKGDAVIVAYEVFTIRIQEAGKRIFPNGKEALFKHRELMPRNEDFGFRAWSFLQRDHAEQKFNELTVKNA